MHVPNVEPRSYVRLRGRIPIKGAPAPHFGAPPDGYTMVMGQTSNLAVNPNLYSRLPYDSLKDFAPVTLVSSMPIALMVWAKSPYAKLNIITRLSTETSCVLSKPEMRERLASAGEEVAIGPEAFTALLKSDHAKWGRMIREAGIKVE